MPVKSESLKISLQIMFINTFSLQHNIFAIMESHCMSNQKNGFFKIIDKLDMLWYIIQAVFYSDFSNYFLLN